MSLMLRRHHKSHLSEADQKKIEEIDKKLFDAKADYLAAGQEPGEDYHKKSVEFTKLRKELSDKKAKVIADAHQSAKDKLYDPKAVEARRAATMERKEKRSLAGAEKGKVEGQKEDPQPEAQEEAVAEEAQTEMPVEAVEEKPKAKGKNGSSKKG